MDKIGPVRTWASFRSLIGIPIVLVMIAVKLLLTLSMFWNEMGVCDTAIKYSNGVAYLFEIEALLLSE